MGKNKHKKRACISMPNSHPKLLWGIVLNMLDHHEWRHVKKRLPHWKHGGNKQHRGDGKTVYNKASAVGELQEISHAKVDNYNAEVEQATPADENSDTAGIKSLFSEEVSKGNDQIHRSSTCPISPQLMRTLSIHRLDPLHEDFLAEIISDDDSTRVINETNGNFRATGLKGPLSKSLRELFTKETYEDHQLMLIQNAVGHNQINKMHETQHKENHMFPQEDSEETLLEINTTELATEATLYRVEDFLNSLDIIKLNKEIFMKLLNDPSSPLAKHFHSRQTLDARRGLTKSKTFPLLSLSVERYEPKNLRQKKNVIGSHDIGGKMQVVDQAQNSNERQSKEDVYKHSILATTLEHRADGIQKVDNEMDESGRSSSLASPQHKNSGSKRGAVRYFKHLKRKLKHAIKESKKERDRIAMDAILHKIPHGQGFSSDLKMENFDKFKDPFIKGDGKDSHASGNESIHATLSSKRVPPLPKKTSLNKTLNTFTQLYEPSFNREARQCVPGGLKLRREETTLLSRTTPKSLTRILSLPELKSYFYQGEDPLDASPWMLVRAPEDETASRSSVEEQIKADMPVASKHSSQLDALAESKIQENLTKVTETDPVIGDKVRSISVVCNNAEAKLDKFGDDLSNLMSKDSTCSHDQDIKPVAPEDKTAGTGSFEEQNKADKPVASEHSSRLDALAESKIQENLTKVTETVLVIGDQVGSNSVACIDADAEEGKLGDDSSNLMSKGSTCDDDHNIKPVSTKVVEPSPVPMLDFNSQEVADSTVDFFISEEPEVKLGHPIWGEQDSFTDHCNESGKYTPMVALSSDFEKERIPSNHVQMDIPLVQVDVKDKAKFDYVKNVLKLSGFSRNEPPGTWHSDYQPVDPSVYDEIEGCIPFDLDCSGNEDGSCNHMLLFNIINETLMEIYERSYSYYPKRLSSLCHIHPMPAGKLLLKEVWTNINSYLNLRPELNHSLNYLAREDLSKEDGWMNLQLDSESVGLELEDLIWEELIEEAIFS